MNIWDSCRGRRKFERRVTKKRVGHTQVRRRGETRRRRSVEGRDETGFNGVAWEQRGLGHPVYVRYISPTVLDRSRSKGATGIRIGLKGRIELRRSRSDTLAQRVVRCSTEPLLPKTSRLQ